MRPLESGKLIEDWAKWRREFNIHLASEVTDVLDNKAILHLFLDSLGAEGCALVHSLCSQLQKEQQDQWTFDEVWWRFNQHCLVKQDPVVEAKLIAKFLKERKELRRISYGDIEKDESRWLQLLPDLCLCEMEYLSQVNPRLEQIIRNYSKLFGVQVEECCLTVSGSTLESFGSLAPALTLRSLSETNAHRVLKYFNRIETFSMHHMKILDDISGFPDHLQELTLVHCAIEDHLLTKWLSMSSRTLKRLHLEQLRNFFCAGAPFRDRHILNISVFETLTSCTIKSHRLRVDMQCKSLEFLNVTAKIIGDAIFKCTKLTHLYFDIPNFSWMYVIMICKEALTTLKELTVRTWYHLGEYKTEPPKFSRWPKPLDLRDFKSIERLEVLSLVDPKFKEDVGQLTFETVQVNYESPPVPASDPDLILYMLNDDCLLEVIGYLPVTDWMRFGLLHPRIQDLLSEFKYPRTKFNVRHFEESQVPIELLSELVVNLSVSSYMDGKDFDWNILHSLHSVQSLEIMRQTLRPEMISLLPDKLEQLKVNMFGNMCSLDEPSWAAYLKRLNGSLRVLEMECLPRDDRVLRKMDNIKEVTIGDGDYSGKSTKAFETFLESNLDTLERINYRFNAADDWSPYEKTFKLLARVKNLKDLAIPRFLRSAPFSSYVDGKGKILAELMENVGPKLKRLSLEANFFASEIRIILNCAYLSNLRELHVNIGRELRKTVALPLIMALRDLRKLRFDDVMDPANLLDECDFIVLLKALPDLAVLDIREAHYSLRFEEELRAYLRRDRRSLLINGVLIGSYGE